MMRKKGIVILLSLCLVVLMIGCGKKVDEATVKLYSSKAEEVIVLINSGDFESIAIQFDDTMKSQLSVEQLAQITPIIVDSGDYKGIKKKSVTEKDGFIVVVLVAEYSKQNRVYTVSYNEQAQIAGLFVQ